MSESRDEHLKVIARAPFELYYDGEATSLTAANKVGEFDILPGHADFFSVLRPCEILIENDTKEPTKFEISGGIVTVRDNEVMLFCNM